MARDTEAVQRVLEKASYFVIFSVPDPQSLSQPIPLLPFLEVLAYAIKLIEVPRRLQIRTPAPTAECGFRTGKRIGRQIANQTLQLQVTPNYFQSGAGRTPPPTLLIPLLSQRFWMSDGNFSFQDGEDTRFTAQAAGRFFPAGGLSLWVGGVGEMLQGFGQLQGFIGNLVIAGLTTPPDKFANAFFFRFPDPTGALNADALPPVEAQEPDLDDSDSALLTLISEPVPDRQPETGPGPGGKLSFRLVERLRLADTNIDVRPGFMKSKTDVGEVVGEHSWTLFFDPDDPKDTTPGYSAESKFVFYAGGKQVGTLKADLSEARLFRTTTSELAQPYFRFGGFGLLGEGTGQFVGLAGMIAVNGALSLDPWATSSMYMLRILDPQGSFQNSSRGTA